LVGLGPIDAEAGQGWDGEAVRSNSTFIECAWKW